MEAAPATREAGVPRARRQVGDIVLDDADFGAPCGRQRMHRACTPARAARSRRACCCRARATTRPSRSLKASFENIPYGDPTDLGNLLGPLIIASSSASACSATSRRARRKAPRVVTGGGRPEHLEKGYFVEPTLFVDVDNSMTIAQEEIFGPVLVGDPATRTTTTRCASPTTRSTACRARSSPATSSAPWPSRAASAPARSP